MIHPLRIVVVLFAFFLSSVSFGQQHAFLHYSSKDGLPQSQINDIIQDQDGFLWIATNGGLSRFDGTRFENFSTLNGLSRNEVRRLDIDEDGILWLADLSGISSFNGHTFKTFPFDESTSSIWDLYSDGDTIWVSCADGLIKFSMGKFELFKFSENPDFRIRSINRDGKDLWIFTKESAFIFNGKAEIPEESKNLPWIGYVKKTSKGVFMLSSRLGLFKDYDDTAPILDFKNDLPNQSVVGLTETKKGDLWIGLGNSLAKWDGSTIKIIDEKNGLPYNDLSCIYVDNDNVLWVGSNGSGLYKYNGELITTYTMEDGLNSNLIMGIEEHEGSMYTITYDKGLNQLSNDKISAIDYRYEGSLGRGWTIASDGKGIWTGHSRGLVYTHANKSKVYTVDDGLLSNYCISLFYDKQTEILHIGSRNGYTELRHGRFTQHSFEDGFPIDRVRYINKDNNGRLWFAGNNGVASFDGEVYTHYSDSTGLPSRSSYNLEFYDNKTWIGTNNGLCYIENDEIHTTPLSSSLKDLYINLLINDKRGKLWIGTNNGIYSLKIDSTDAIQLNHYGMQNGLLGLETNLNASHLDENGNVFFGFEQGLVRFDRNEIDLIEKQSPPKIILTNLHVYLKEVDWKSRGDSLIARSKLPINLKLKPKENYLTFNFSGINTVNPDEVRYRFMLEGAEGELSRNWSTPSKNNFATFSNLASGDYVFKVQSVNGNSNWPNTFVSYPFTIKTPFYATWWFRSLIALALFLIVFGIYTWRMRTIRQEQENLRLRSQSKMLALEQQTLNANMNRHFVFNALNSIQYYLNKEDKMSANRYLSRFAKLIRKNLDSSQSKQTTLFEEIDRMVLYMELEQMRFSHKFDFEFKVDKNINTREIKIPSMLFQPYLENSIWHGILPMENHGQIEVEVSGKEENSISIKIFDNGIGIDTSLKHKTENQDHISVGMEITKNRLALYEQLSKKEASVIGPYEIQEKGVTIGTQVELILPRLNGQN